MLHTHAKQDYQASVAFTIIFILLSLQSYLNKLKWFLMAHCKYWTGSFGYNYFSERFMALTHDFEYQTHTAQSRASFEKVCASHGILKYS